MAFSRSMNARSKSRSPAPPVGFQSQSKGNFYPPSYYAAAAGLPYPRRGGSSDTAESSSMSTSSALGSPMSFKSYSLASQSVSPEASSFGSNTAAHNRQSVLKRRESQLGNMEAQLVPSLRDTINRMTMSPQRTSVIESTSSPPSQDPTPPSHDPFARSQHDQSAASTSSASPLRQRENSPLVPPSTPKHASTPKAGSTQITTTVDVESSSHHQKLKSVLKSYLRPPTPKLTQQNARSMVVDLKKGVGMASYLKASSPNIDKNVSPTPSPLQGSAATDSPGHTSRSSSRKDTRKDPTTSRAPSVPPATPTIGNSSRLPRRSDFSQQRRNPQMQSDSEPPYSPGGSAWKLRVANGSIAHSSSSESDSQFHNVDEQFSKLPRPRELQQSLSRRYHQEEDGSARTRSRFGLGFGLRRDISDPQKAFEANDIQSEGPLTMMGEGMVAESVDEHLSNAAFSSESSSLAWENDNQEAVAHPSETSSRRTSYDVEEPLDVHRQRRETLLGVVQDLNSSLRDRPSRISFASEASDYKDRDGLMISDSGHLQDYSYPSKHYPSPQDRQSSRAFDESARSPLPTFKVSSDEDYDAQNRGSHRQNPEPQRNSRLSQSPHQVSHHAPAYSSDTRELRTHPASPNRSPRMRADNPPPRHANHSGYQRPASPLFLPSENGRHRRIPEQEQRLARENQKASGMSSVAESQYAAATRQRQAFGIPRPISDYYTDSIHEASSEERLSHANSDLSSVGDDLWREDCEISADAERLFTQVSEKGDRADVRAEQWQGEVCDQDQRYEHVYPEDRRSGSSLSQRSDASSVYDEAILVPSASADQDVYERQEPPVSGDGHLWRSTLSDNQYCSLLAQYGEVEMQRQQVIWELCTSEEAFVRRLHCVVDVFVQPLRIHNSKAWIFGVPLPVAHLFDWLEDIGNLHTQILDMLHAARTPDRPVLECLAGMWKTFVPRLEVYQPYLVRLEETAALVEQLMMDEHSDFGEFVNIQEGSSACQGWSLERFLIEPVNRLAQYPEFFRRLHSMTTRSHPDYLSTFAVLQSMNMIIRVMSEVKFREDEYDVIKEIVSRIHGLPTDVVKRERRLLCRGTLRQISLPEHPLGYGPVAPVESIPLRSSRLISAINDWGMRRHVSGSSKSTNSTAMSFMSLETASCASASLTFDKASIIHPRYHAANTPNCNGTRQQANVPGDILHAFIFTDILVLANPSEHRTSSDSPSWVLLEDIGLSRILGVIENTEPPDGSFVFDVIPVGANTLDAGHGKSRTGVTSLMLDLLHDPSTKDSLEVQRIRWLGNARQSAQSTMRSLSSSCLSHSQRLPDLANDMDLDHDTHRSVKAIMSSGLPLPKSPSVQLADLALGEPGDQRQQEREERGWWSLRFQQVLREMQRREAIPLVIP